MSDTPAERDLTPGQRDDVLRRIGSSINEAAREMALLRKGLNTKPSSQQVTRQRRGAVVGLALLVAVAIGTVDEHAERCGPGARVAPGIRYVADTITEDFDVERLRTLLKNEGPRHCDVVVPIHTHGNEPWPSRSNALGLAGYLSALAAWWWWATRSPPAPPAPPPPPDAVASQPISDPLADGPAEPTAQP